MFLGMFLGMFMGYFKDVFRDVFKDVLRMLNQPTLSTRFINPLYQPAISTRFVTLASLATLCAVWLRKALSSKPRVRKAG